MISADKDLSMNGFVKKVRNSSPIVHCITNFVSMNDCANILLGCGALPIMASDVHEAAQICESANSLVLNLGTPNQQRFEAMRIAAETANERGIPIILDPVGVGASDFRKEFAEELLKCAEIAVIRGNLSEIKALCGIAVSEHGVDSAESEDDFDSRLKIAQGLSETTGSCVVISGKDDVVCHRSRMAAVHNGEKMMSKITGSGCMLSALCGAFAAVQNDDLFGAVLCAVAEFGVAGEIARKRMSGVDGSGSMRTYLIDAVSNMTDGVLRREAKYEILQ